MSGKYALALLVVAAPAPAQSGGSEVVSTLDRWLRTYQARKLDMISADDVMGSSRRLVPKELIDPDVSVRITQRDQLKLLLDAAVSENSLAAAQRVLRIAAVGLDEKAYPRRMAPELVRSMGEEAMAGFTRIEVKAYLMEVVATEPEGPTADEQRALRAAAVRAMGRLGDPVLRPRVVGLLATDDPGLRLACADALARLSHPTSVPPLTRAIQVERNGLILHRLVETLTAVLVEHHAALDTRTTRATVLAALDAIGRTDAWQADLAIVRFLERFRTTAAVPALIAILERHDPGSTQGPRSQRLRAEAHRVLKALTGSVYGKEDTAEWRRFWEEHKDHFKLAPMRSRQTDPSATEASGFFGIPVSGTRVVFVIDVSGSMQAPLPDPKHTYSVGTPTRLDTARREALKAVSELPEDAFFNLVAFSGRATAWRKGLVPATLANKKKFRAYLGSLAADGGTNLWDGLQRALRMRTPARAPGVPTAVDEVFLLSDGQPSTGEVQDAREIVRLITAQNHYAKVRINTVFIGSVPSLMDLPVGGASLMIELASRNEGRFVQR